MSKQLFLLLAIHVGLLFVYAVAVQGKTHKGAFAITFSSVGIFSTASETGVLIILSLCNT